jgi:hypothetical protein
LPQLGRAALVLFEFASGFTSHSLDFHVDFDAAGALQVGHLRIRRQLFDLIELLPLDLGYIVDGRSRSFEVRQLLAEPAKFGNRLLPRHAFGLLRRKTATAGAVRSGDRIGNPATSRKVAGRWS